jgi:hypothetical protein
MAGEQMAFAAKADAVVQAPHPCKALE